MEVFGGFMVMMSIISLFLAVVWLVMPFVVFAIKGKQDRMLEVLEAIEKRLAALEAALRPAEPELAVSSDVPSPESSSGSSSEHPVEDAVTPADHAAEKKSPEASPVE